MVETFRIVLRDINGHEGLVRRKFDLALGGTFPIGRASRSTAKAELMPATNNGYINSPVISREHAELSAKTDQGQSHVYIKDVGSMHGTLVNGQRLSANVPRQLASGDILQFGIDVNRNEEYYVARKYHFEAQLTTPPPPYSLGISVPDSEDEDIDLKPRRGSQSDPLLIDDDSDAENAQEAQSVTPQNAQSDQVDVTMVDDDSIIEREAVAPSEGQTHDEEYPKSSMRTIEDEDLYSEDETSSVDYPSEDGQEVHFDDLDSVGSPQYDSEMDSGSEHGFHLSDLEDEHSDDIEVSDDRSDRSMDAAMDENSVKDVNSLPAIDDVISLRSFDLTTSYQAPSYSVSELPPFAAFREAMNMGHSNFGEFYAPPLPPRPSADAGTSSSRPESSDAPQQSDQWGWYSEQTPFDQGHDNIKKTDSTSLVDKIPSMSSQELPAMRFDPYSAPSAGRIQTPPLFHTTDVTSTTPPPPSRRTKVSITEIVEEQPPTPTSINDKKRKASVLEEEETLIRELPVLASASADMQPDHDVVEAIQIAEVIAQRPKKQPRSMMSKLKNTATFIGYGAVGAVGAFAVLSNLPDTFFT